MTKTCLPSISARRISSGCDQRCAAVTNTVSGSDDGELAHDPLGDVVPLHLVTGGALGEAGHVVDQPGQHGRRLDGQQDRLDPVGVGGAADVGAFPVQRPAQLGVDLGDVVGEQQPVVLGDADTADVDAARRVAGPGQHLAGRRRLQHLDRRVEHEEEAHRLGDVGVGDPGQGDVGAVDVGRWRRRRRAT